MGLAGIALWGPTCRGGDIACLDTVPSAMVSGRTSSVASEASAIAKSGSRQPSHRSSASSRQEVQRREDEAPVCIIGSGPAAYTAAFYAARHMLRVIVFEGYLASGLASGGQINLTDHVENFPGFPDGHQRARPGREAQVRPWLGRRQLHSTPTVLLTHSAVTCRAQAEIAGVTFIGETVDKVDAQCRPFRVYSSATEVVCATVIIATGKRATTPWVLRTTWGHPTANMACMVQAPVLDGCTSRAQT